MRVNTPTGVQATMDILTSTAQFDQFVGREVMVTKSHRTLKIGAEEIELPEYTLASDDTVIKEIEGMWSDVRVWLPNTMGTMDYVTGRLNVYVTEGEGGKYTISKVDFG